MLEENDSRDQLWAVSEIFLRAGRNRSSVRHNSFLWSLAPLRFVLNVKGKIPYTDGRPLGRPAGASVVGECDCVGHVRGDDHVPLDAHVPLVRDGPLGEIRSNCG